MNEQDARVTAFDPTRFQFVQLEDFRIPGDVPVYEYKNHPAVDGREGFCASNLYLTMDNSLRDDLAWIAEPIATEAECENGRLASSREAGDFDFREYNEDLFRGYIDSDEAAGYIFKALRLGESQRYLRTTDVEPGSGQQAPVRLVAKLPRYPNVAWQKANADASSHAKSQAGVVDRRPVGQLRGKSQFHKGFSHHAVTLTTTG